MNEETDSYDDLLFDVRRSVRYHTRRRHHYDVMHKCVLFVALVFSSATVVTFAGEVSKEWDLWAKSLPAVLVSILAALDLVLGTTTKSWQHADLARQFIDLERQLETRKNESLDILLPEITDKRLQIEATEPPILRVLDTLCHNEMLRAMGHDRDQEVKVNFIQRLFAPLFDVAEWRLHQNQ